MALAQSPNIWGGYLSKSSGDLVLETDLLTDQWLSKNYNTFIGVSVAGAGNLAHGAGAEGWYNTLIGYNAGNALTIGSTNVAVGSNALDALTTGYDSVAVGHNSQTSNEGGQRNISMGRDSLYTDASGNNNVAIGYRALYTQNGVANNIAVGHNAGNSQTGASNVMVGYQAGYNNTGSTCVMLGYQAGYSNTRSNSLFIDNTNSATPLIYGEFDNDNVGFSHSADFGGGAGMVAIHNATTVPTSTLTNAAAFYATAGEMWTIDAAGNKTQLSPHNDAGEWVFRSDNVVTGKSYEVNMAHLVEIVEQLSGQTLAVRS